MLGHVACHVAPEYEYGQLYGLIATPSFNMIRMLLPAATPPVHLRASGRVALVRNTTRLCARSLLLYYKQRPKLFV